MFLSSLVGLLRGARNRDVKQRPWDERQERLQLLRKWSTSLISLFCAAHHPMRCRSVPWALSVETHISLWTIKTWTHMDVELHILPLAETSKFVTGGKRCGFSNTFAHCSTQSSHPPTPLSHLSMNFWKIFPLKLSQISTMYGCEGTDINSRSSQGFFFSKTMWFGSWCEYVLCSWIGWLN